jgi:hypothetical protein
VDTVLEGGSARKSVDVVILGDGYVAEDLAPDGAYERDVKATVEALFELSPYREYKDWFNVYAVYAESFDRGAEDEFGRNDKKTILDATFDRKGGRLLMIQRPENAARLAKNAPATDIVLIVVNDDRYGGSGGVLAGEMPAPVFASSPESVQIAIHELGHSFAGLGDEYADPEAAETRPVPLGTKDFEEPNLTRARFVDTTSPETIAKTVKWKHFLELPGAGGVISAFEGGYYQPEGVFRPQARCKMRENEAPFCHVCRETIARNIHRVAKRKFDHDGYHEQHPIR